MLTVYWPTGLCATSINKVPILMLAVLPSEGSFHVATTNWQLQTRQWDAECLFHLHVGYQWVTSTTDWFHIFWVSLGKHIIIVTCIHELHVFFPIRTPISITPCSIQIFCGLTSSEYRNITLSINNCRHIHNAVLYTISTCCDSSANTTRNKNNMHFFYLTGCNIIVLNKTPQICTAVVEAAVFKLWIKLTATIF
jgi:hypothetical protein